MPYYECPRPIGNFLVLQEEFDLTKIDFLVGLEQRFLFHNPAYAFWYQTARQHAVILSLGIKKMYSLFRHSFFIPLYNAMDNLHKTHERFVSVLIRLSGAFPHHGLSEIVKV